jgi:hypothetical protein
VKILEVFVPPHQLLAVGPGRCRQELRQIRIAAIVDSVLNICDKFRCELAMKLATVPYELGTTRRTNFFDGTLKPCGISAHYFGQLSVKVAARLHV